MSIVPFVVVDIRFATLVLVVSVWSISTLLLLPVNATVIAWSALPDCKVSISLELPETVQLLIKPTTLHLTLAGTGGTAQLFEVKP